MDKRILFRLIFFVPEMNRYFIRFVYFMNFESLKHFLKSNRSEMLTDIKLIDDRPILDTMSNKELRELRQKHQNQVEGANHLWPIGTSRPYR